MAITNVSKEWDLRCLSTDANPTNTESLPDNVALFEVDTGKVFFFRKATGKWLTTDGEERT